MWLRGAVVDEQAGCRGAVRARASEARSAGGQQALGLHRTDDGCEGEEVEAIEPLAKEQDAGEDGPAAGPQESTGCGDARAALYEGWRNAACYKHTHASEVRSDRLKSVASLDCTTGGRGMNKQAGRFGGNCKMLKVMTWDSKRYAAHCISTSPLARRSHLQKYGCRRVHREEAHRKDHQGNADPRVSPRCNRKSFPLKQGGLHRERKVVKVGARRRMVLPVCCQWPKPTCAASGTADSDIRVPLALAENGSDRKPLALAPA